MCFNTFETREESSEEDVLYFIYSAYEDQFNLYGKSDDATLDQENAAKLYQDLGMKYP